MSTVISRAVTIIYQGWIARCLGAGNLGMSGSVLAITQQVTLLGGFGLDTVASRLISKDASRAVSITYAVVRFRVLAALLICGIGCWIVVATVPQQVRGPWYAGTLIVLFGATNLTFVYQALQRLPNLGWLSLAGACVSAAIAFAVVRPGAGAGVDIVLTATATAVTAVLALLLLPSTANMVTTQVLHKERAPLAPLLRQSWKYLLQTALVFFYYQYQVPLIGWRLGMESAGQFRAAFLAATAVELGFNSLSGLLLPRLVGANKLGAQNLWKEQLIYARYLSMVGAGCSIVLIALAPNIIETIFGPGFEQAVAAFRWLVVGRTIVLTGQVFVFGLAARQMDSSFVAVAAIGVVVSITGNALLIDNMGINGVALVSVLAESAVAVSAILLLRNTRNQ